MVTRNIKSALTNQIFKQEMLHTYEQKSQSRDELVRGARRMIRQLTQEMAQSLCAAPEIEQKMEQLVGQLETVKGKKSYGYLPESVKKTVDEAVDKLEELSVMTSGASSKMRWRTTATISPENEKSWPRRKSFGRSRTLSSKRRRISAWV